MTVEQYAQLSNYLVASATVVLALSWLAYMGEWAFGRAATKQAQPQLVAAGGDGADGPAGEDETRRETFDLRSEMSGRIGLNLTVLGLALLVVAIVTRGLAAERVPWGNMYEFGMTGSALVLTGFLILVKTNGVNWLGPLVTGFVVVVLGLSMTVYVPAGPLVPALHSYWLFIHVTCAMIAAAAFTVGAALSVLYLVKSRAEQRTPEEERQGYLWRLPSSASMDQLAYRVHAFGFPIWTFAALIAGPIWAQYAWGRYWGWDPKEVWAFITWVFYAGYLHARATAGWKGKAAAILALVAFATVIFNFVGVNLFVGGLHSYAK